MDSLSMLLNKFPTCGWYLEVVKSWFRLYKIKTCSTNINDNHEIHLAYKLTNYDYKKTLWNQQKWR